MMTLEDMDKEGVVEADMVIALIGAIDSGVRARILNQPRGGDFSVHDAKDHMSGGFLCGWDMANCAISDASGKQWYSAEELAGLPGMPDTAAGVDAAAAVMGWASRPRRTSIKKSRARKGGSLQ